MLGEKIGEWEGQMTGVRVLETSPAPKFEVSFQANGRLLSADTQELGTYSSVLRPDGSMYGEGHGVSMTADGDVAAWVGNGIGIPTGQGMAASWRGAIYYKTTSERWASLNGIAVVYEFEVEADGKVKATTFGWS